MNPEPGKADLNQKEKQEEKNESRKDDQKGDGDAQDGAKGDEKDDHPEIPRDGGVSAHAGAGGAMKGEGLPVSGKEIEFLEELLKEDEAALEEGDGAGRTGSEIPKKKGSGTVISLDDGSSKMFSSPDPEPKAPMETTVSFRDFGKGETLERAEEANTSISGDSPSDASLPEDSPSGGITSSFKDASVFPAGKDASLHSPDPSSVSSVMEGISASDERQHEDPVLSIAEDTLGNASLLRSRAYAAALRLDGLARSGRKPDSHDVPSAQTAHSGGDRDPESGQGRDGRESAAEAAPAGMVRDSASQGGLGGAASEKAGSGGTALENVSGLKEALKEASSQASHNAMAGGGPETEGSPVSGDSFKGGKAAPVMGKGEGSDGRTPLKDGADREGTKPSEKKKGGKAFSTGRLGQTRIYLGKLFRMFIYERGWRMLPLSAAISLMVSYVAGRRMFYNMEGTQSCAFAFSCVCIWNGFFNSIQMVCRERAIIKREHRAGLHITSYIMAHMLYQAFLCALQVAISVAIYKWYGMKFPSSGVLLPVSIVEFAFSLWLVTYCADMMALMISCIVHTTTAAMTVMPFLLIIQLVFAGIIFTMNSGVPYYISQTTISRWGTRIICAESKYNELPSQAFFAAIWQFKDVEEVRPIIDYINQPDIREKLDYYSAEKRQIREYDSTVDNVLNCFGALAGFSLLYASIGTIFLEFVDRDKR